LVNKKNGQKCIKDFDIFTHAAYKSNFWATEQAGLFTTMYIQLEKTRGGQLMYTAKKGLCSNC